MGVRGIVWLRRLYCRGCCSEVSKFDVCFSGCAARADLAVPRFCDILSPGLIRSRLHAGRNRLVGLTRYLHIPYCPTRTYSHCLDTELSSIAPSL